MFSWLEHTSGITNPYTKACRITNPTRWDFYFRHRHKVYGVVLILYLIINTYLK